MLSKSLRLFFLFVCSVLGVGFAANSEELSSKPVSIQPPKIEIKTVSEMTLGKQTFQSLTLQVTNLNSLPIVYTGYAPNSFAPSMPVDRIAPMYQIAVWNDDKWDARPIGRCGTGVTDLPLQPRKKVTFDVAIPKGNWRMMKVEFGQLAGWTKGVKTSTMWSVVVMRDEQGKMSIP